MRLEEIKAFIYLKAFIKLILVYYFNFLIFYSQLFYLITDLYKEGNGKEMRKWAYEIHSSFLVPGAVSKISNYTLFLRPEISDAV